MTSTASPTPIVALLRSTVDARLLVSLRVMSATCWSDKLIMLSVWNLAVV